ncbi:MAG: hypothetical protein ACTSUT_05965, partial [Promethearchaeota archaeon]
SKELFWTFGAITKQFKEWKELGIEILHDNGFGDDYTTFSYYLITIISKIICIFTFRITSTS